MSMTTRKNTAPPLSDVEAAERKIKVDRDGLVKCRVCSCTEIRPCFPPCAWVEVDLCDGCGQVLKAMVEWAEGAHRPSVLALIREFNRLRKSVFSRLARKAQAGGR